MAEIGRLARGVHKITCDLAAARDEVEALRARVNALRAVLAEWLGYHEAPDSDCLIAERTRALLARGPTEDENG